MTMPPYRKQKHDAALFPLLFIALFVVSSCIGGDHAQAYCDRKGHVKGSRDFKECVEARHRYNEHLFHRHRATGP